MSATHAHVGEEYRREAARVRTLISIFRVVMICAVLGGCGGGGGGGNSVSGGAGGNCLGANSGFCGTLSGLPSGQTVTVYFSTSDVGGGPLTLSANGPFSFQLLNPIDVTTTYDISVTAEPPDTDCSVTSYGSNSNPSGEKVIVVTGVVITCSPGVDYTLGGTLTGLNSGQQVTVEDNGAEALVLTGNGSFTFPDKITGVDGYSVSVSSQPAGQACLVSNGGGTHVSANVSNIAVVCSDTIGGTLSGLTAGEEFTVLDNGGDPLVLTANGAFTFPTGVADGQPYAVTVGTQPTGEYCTVSNGSGSSGPASNVQVTCVSNERVLYAFTGASDGGGPYDNVIMDGAGNLYGTTEIGGAHGYGVVFKLAPTGSGGYTESVLYSFLGSSGDGLDPFAGLIMDGAGNLYGTTYAGGNVSVSTCNTGFGTVFKLAPNGSGGYTESVLYAFNGGTADGIGPYAAVVMDGQGNLYGTTKVGGSGNSDCSDGLGVVFKLAPNGSGGYTESILHTFAGGTADGQNPQTALIVDGNGNLYGTTETGGANNEGTVFELAPNGSGGYAESILHSFGADAGDGTAPAAGLIMGGAGSFYGTTAAGGAHGAGAVFELAPNGSGGYTESIVYSFSGGQTDAASPRGLVMDGAGNLYGTAESGGIYSNSGYGTVFKLAPAGGGYAGSLLYSFLSGGDGATPTAGLVMDSSGNLYGTTEGGGNQNNNNVICTLNNGCGTVFEIFTR
jgi:uncharacterized repeat protein (TIGR03803 family)